MSELNFSNQLFATYENILLKCPLFKEVEAHKLRGLLGCLSTSFKQFNEDEYIFHLGDNLSYIYIVLGGTVEIAKETISGSRNIVSFLGPGQLFGEGVVCTQKKLSPVSARVVSDASLLLIPYERILKTCGNSCNFHHQLIHNMMLLLGEKNYMLNHKIDILMLKSMRQKLLTYLLNESQHQDSLSFNIPLNRTELADYLNVSRPSMCRELGRLKEEGLIDYYKNTFKLLNPEHLKNYCK